MPGSGGRWSIVLSPCCASACSDWRWATSAAWPHVNGLESFWATLKRAHKGVYHKISEKHLQRYVDQFTAKHNIRDNDTIDQMRDLVAGMIGKRLMYRDLVG